MSTQELKFSSQTKKASLTYSSTEINQETKTITSSTWSTNFIRRSSMTRSEDYRPFLRGNERATIATSRLPPLRPTLKEPVRKTSLLNDAFLYHPPSDQSDRKKKSPLKNGPVYVFSNSQLDKNKNVVNSYENDINLLKEAFSKFNMEVIPKKEKSKSKIQNRIKISKKWLILLWNCN